MPQIGLVLLLLLLCVGSLPAQQLSELPSGTRMRLRTTVPPHLVEADYARRWMVGTLESADTVLLVLTTAGAAGRTYRIPVEVIRRAEISRGIVSGREGFMQALPRGAAAGALGGLAWIGTLRLLGVGFPCPDCTASEKAWWVRVVAPEPTGTNAIQAAFGGATVGGALSGLLGSLPHERWQRVSGVGGSRR